MWMMAVAGAMAASTGNDVTAALSRWPEADLGVACAPVGALLRVASKLPLPPGALQGASGEMRAFVDLLDPAKAAAAGVDPEGTFLLVGGGKSKTDAEVRIPFAGDRDQADALLRRFYGEVEVSEDVWRVTDAGKAMLARLDGGALVVQSVSLSVAATPAPEPLQRLVGGLPEVPGCTVVVRGIDTEKADGALSVFIPLSGGAPLLGRVQLDQLPGPPELARGGLPVDGAHTPDPPSAVIHVGVSVDSLLDAMAKSPAFADAPIEKLHGVASFGAGATIAFFGNPRERRFAAVLPLTAPDGTPLNPRKVARVIVKMADGELKRVGGTGFRGEVQDMELHGAVEKGRVVVATDAGLLDTVVADTGEAWISPTMRTFAQDWPITVQTYAGPDTPLVVRSGVRTREGLWEVSVEVKGVTPEMAAMMTGMLSAIAMPNFIQMQAKAARAGLANDVDAIRAAELAWLTDHGTALALPTHPRAVEQLGKDGVLWRGPEALVQLGEDPGSETVKGTYWVEVTPDGKGFTVYGAIDADGDGAPARYRATRDLPAEKETGDGVY